MVQKSDEIATKEKMRKWAEYAIELFQEIIHTNSKQVAGEKMVDDKAVGKKLVLLKGVF